MQEGEALDYDPTAYDCLHQFTLDWPCLRYAAHKTLLQYATMLTHDDAMLTMMIQC